SRLVWLPVVAYGLWAGERSPIVRSSTRRTGSSRIGRALVFFRPPAAEPHAVSTRNSRRHRVVVELGCLILRGDALRGGKARTSRRGCRSDRTLEFHLFRPMDFKLVIFLRFGGILPGAGRYQRRGQDFLRADGRNDSALPAGLLPFD